MTDDRNRILALATVVALAMTSWAGAGSESTAQQRRELARLHRTLDAAKRDNDVHDACLALGKIGNASSVPHLIKALRLFPDVEPKPGQGFVCTQEHCVSALRQITGVNPGFAYTSWRDWYDAQPGRTDKRE